MKFNALVYVGMLMAFYSCAPKQPQPLEKPAVIFDSLATTPPMGWNSWDCLGLDANEEQIKAVADYMADNLKKYGWEYIVIDAGWYHPKELITAAAHTHNPTQNMDAFGRLIPDTLKYPSAKGGLGFKPLADYIHSKGLKFGIHVMRGIPWNAVANATPIKGTSLFADKVANLLDTCPWSPIMKGVDMDKPGAQEYYNSVYQLYADWGVDFVKVDDMSFPYHKAEIEAVHQAIINSGAPIVFSLSPGPAPVNEIAHLTANATMWRISGDFWDDWKWLKLQFDICHQWDSVHTPGHWPDADMLPIGKLRKTGGDAWIASQLGSTIEEVSDEYSRFTDNEKYTLFTLYSIFRSPLMLGGYLPENDSVTYKIITNEEVIAVNKNGSNSHEIRNKDGIIIWTSDDKITHKKYVAIFNINDGASARIWVPWEELGIKGEKQIRDLWAKKELGIFNKEFSANIEPHSCLLISL